MCDAEVAEWLKENALKIPASTVGMGVMERTLDQVCLEARRLALEQMTQEVADRQPFDCPQCHAGLNVDGHKRRRKVKTTFGNICFFRAYGFCPVCCEYFYPADAMLGLQNRAPSSPRVQEICALTTLRAPAGQVEDDVYRLTGIKLSASILHREARRQGERALILRNADEQLTQTANGIAELTGRSKSFHKNDTLVIEIDAWNIRERDNWGKTKSLLKVGKDTERWHWVYTGTVFRLGHRGSTKSGRPVITERGFVATRKGIESFQRQLYAEALQRGFSKAKKVLILADGAVWIWNIADDRFKNATQRVDLFHVHEHLWDLAHELYGRGTVAAKEWIQPYLHSLQKCKDGALKVITSFDEMTKNIKGFTETQREAITRKYNYFDQHKHRMDYKVAKALGQPLGSGAIESTCSQYQRRFKLTGQFWSLSGDEAFLALSSLHRNNRWQLLFSNSPK